MSVGTQRVTRLAALIFWTLGPYVAGQTASRRVGTPFVENRGQLDKEVAFSAKTLTGAMAVMTDGRLVYSLNGARLTETLVSGRPRPAAGLRAEARLSYLLGADPLCWQTNIQSFDSVGLGEVWRGVEVSLRVSRGWVEKVFTVRPGGRLGAIRLRIDGAQTLRVERGGALVARADRSDVRFTAPVAYQESRAGRQRVEVAYALHGSTYGFRLGRHDSALPVVIDPILQSTYVGGPDPDSVNAMTIDPGTGDVIVAGHSYSDQRDIGRGVDGFVARFDSTLKTLLHFTYIGGSDANEILGVAAHPVTGDVYVAGFTTSLDFPGTLTGAQPNHVASEDGFVARLDSTLTNLLGATYFGGHSFDKIVGVAVHPSTGEIFIAGKTLSADLPGMAGAGRPDFNADLDGFVARFDPTLTRLNQATHLSNHRSVLHAMAIHPSTGDILVVGHGDMTSSLLGRIDPSLRSPAQLNFIEGPNDNDLFGIAVDPRTGDVLATGWTANPTLPGAEGGAQPRPASPPNGIDAFVARFDSSLTVMKQATYLGGADNDYAYGIAIHPSNGDIYVTGETFSTDLPATSGAAQSKSGGGFDGFVARLNPTLTRFVKTTYLGGTGDDTPLTIAIHPMSGEILIAGETTSPDLPGALCGARSWYAGGDEFFGGDGFVTALSADLANSTQVPDESCVGSRGPVLLPSPRHQPRTTTRSVGSRASGFSERQK